MSRIRRLLSLIGSGRNGSRACLNSGDVKGGNRSLTRDLVAFDLCKGLDLIGNSYQISDDGSGSC